MLISAELGFNIAGVIKKRETSLPRKLKFHSFRRPSFYNYALYYALRFIYILKEGREFCDTDIYKKNKTQYSE
jgi:hypothetical protein